MIKAVKLKKKTVGIGIRVSIMYRIR